MANGTPQNDAIGRRFGLLRKRAEQDVKAGVGEQQEALKRRFASLGATGSGESIKLEQQTQQRGQKALGEAREGLAVAESGERQRAGEIQAQREFQKGEREASQTFGAGQAKLGREFARGERLGGQGFAAEQALNQLNFAKSEAGLNRTLQSDQFNQEFDLNSIISQFNMDLAAGIVPARIVQQKAAGFTADQLRSSGMPQTSAPTTSPATSPTSPTSSTAVAPKGTTASAKIAALQTEMKRINNPGGRLRIAMEIKRITEEGA